MTFSPTFGRVFSPTFKPNSQAGGISVPTDISNCILWLDFADANTLFTDAGTTKVSSDGQAIYQANDKSGNAKNATQATLTNRPLYKTNVKNGKSVALFDGANDNFSLPLTANAGSFTIFAAYNNTETLNGTTAAGGYLLDAQTGRLIIALVDTDAGLGYKRLAWYDGAWRHFADATNGWQTNAWHLVSGGNGTIYRNGSSLGADQYTEKAIGGTVRLGAHYATATSFVKGPIGEVVIYSKALSSGELLSVETYLNNKWAIY